MLIVRIVAGLISLVILADFTMATWHAMGCAIALVPALVGACAAALVALKDAASTQQRRLLTASIFFLSLCIAMSLVFAFLHHESSQTALLSALAGIALLLGWRALILARRRRRRAGMYAYFNR